MVTTNEVAIDDFTRKAICMSILIAGQGTIISVERAYSLVEEIEEELMERC